MAINKAMIEDESGDKNIDTIVEDNLQTLLPVKTHLQEEIIDEGRKIIESTEILLHHLFIQKLSRVL